MADDKTYFLESMARRIARRVKAPKPLATAADVYQEVWVKLAELTRPGVYEADPASATVPYERWLYTRALGDTRDAFKTEFRRQSPARRVRVFSAPGGECFGRNDVPVEPAADPLMIRDAVARLPENQRAVVDAIYFRGRTQQQVAAARGTTQAAVSYMLKRALNNLRELV
jgi:RNA polymerase sigma factor (sigma-70 family)